MKTLLCLGFCLIAALPELPAARAAPQANSPSAAPLSAKSERPAESERAGLDRQFHQRLQQLLDECQAEGWEAEAQLTGQTLFIRDPQRQYIFLPDGPTKELPAQLNSAWREKYAQLRAEYAEQLFQLAGRWAEAEAGAPAYQLLHEVLYWDPEHAATRTALGHRKQDEGWQAYSERLTERDAPKPHPELNWPARSYRLVTTENFEIASQADAETTRLLAEQLQRWQWIWRQICFDYWSSPGAIRSWLSGKTRARAASKKFRVVLFRDKEQYTRELEKFVPGVGASTGYYSDQLRLACFYAGEDEPDFATWRHELTHQLFQEAIRTRKSPFSDEHLWLGEGIAMYFEGQFDFGDFVTLGGFDQRRLQFARLRCLQEGKYLPFGELAALSQTAWQTHPEVRQLYSQAAGVTQYLMTGENGRHQAALIDFLKAIYTGKLRSDAWEKVMQVSPEEIDREYPRFLAITPGQVQQYLIAPLAVQELALSNAEMTDQDFGILKECLELRWLDLSGNSLTAARLQSLAGCRQLRQLFATNCQLSPGALAELAKCPQLEELQLSGSRLSAGDLTELQQLPSLRILDLSGCAVPAEGARLLAALPTLEQVDLSHGQLPEGLLDELQSARPRLKILHSPQ